MLASCGPRGGTDVGNGATVTFDLRGFEEKPDAEDPDSAKPKSLVLTNGDRVDELWIVVEKFKLSASGKCTDAEPSSEDADAEGPFVAEVLSEGVLGALPMASVPAGEYCRLEMALHELEQDEAPSAAPDDLIGSAVVMRGQRADGTPFTVRTKQGVKFTLDAVDASFSVADGAPFLLGIELSGLVSSLDLSSLDGPEIVIDSESNQDRLKDFDGALREAARLFEDQNGDGDLSEQESGPDAALAKGQPED